MSEPEPRFLRLLPDREPGVEARAYVEGALGGRTPPPDRPMVFANMIASIDGNAAFDGRSAPLSDRGDRVLFHALRAGADAILVGTGTLAEENYGPAGKPVVTISRSGSLPVGIRLFQQAEGEVIAFCGAPPSGLEAAAAGVRVEPLTDTAGVLARLLRDFGVRRLLCEGGPGLLGAMLRDGLVDELFVTLAPKLAGGFGGTAMTAGDPAEQLIGMRLAGLLERESTLYLRYSRTPGA